MLRGQQGSGLANLAGDQGEKLRRVLMRKSDLAAVLAKMVTSGLADLAVDF